MSAIDNWGLLDSNEDRDEAMRVLATAKEARKNKQYKVVRISHNTWKEIEIKPTTQKKLTSNPGRLRDITNNMARKDLRAVYRACLKLQAQDQLQR